MTCGGGVVVLLTDANERATLAAARSLTRAGYRVLVTAAARHSLAAASHGVRGVRIAAQALVEPLAYAEAVGRVAAAHNVRIILPVTDASVEAILEHRSALPAQAVVPGPDLETYLAASDKLTLLTRARAAGFAVPETVVVRSPHDPDARLGDAFFPAVVKPHRSVIRIGSGKLRVGVTAARNRQELRATLAALPAAAFPVLLQRRVVGPGESLFLLRWDGRTVAAFAHRRLREKPPWGGVSVYRESIPVDPELLHAGEILLSELGWRGLAMVECKRDAVTGRHVIMEVNGRLWGSLQLAIDAGVDFPALLVRSALGQAVSQASAYRTGVRTRWFWGDLDHLYLYLTRTGRGPDSAAPSRLGALAAFLAYRPGRDRLEVECLRDPGPAIVETLRRLGLLR